MINIKKAKEEFKKFLNSYDDKSKLGFDLKRKHTYRVMKLSKMIAKKINLSKEEIKLASLIALLHDIGRFDEITFFNQFNSAKFDHAKQGIKILFDDNLIRNFIKEEKYDEIIKKAVLYHSAKDLPNNLKEEELIQTKIIRDADKLDNLKLRIKTKAEKCFPGNLKNKFDVENASINDKVYKSMMNQECVNVKDRESALDLFICVLGFIYDLNFKESLEIVKENDYVNKLIDKFKYNKEETKEKMENIRNCLNNYIEEKLRSKI